MVLRLFLPLAVVMLAVHAQYNNNRSPYLQQPGQSQYGYPGQNQNPNQQNQFQNRGQMPQQQNPQQQNQQQLRMQGQNFQQQNQFGQQNTNQQQFGQQQQQNQQFNNGQMNTQNSRSAVSTNPIRMTNATDMGATVTLQLRSYSNPQNSLDADTTCACPVANCDFLRANEQNNCQFSFMVVISSADQTVKMIQSDFYPFSQTISQGNWTQQITLQVPTKPSAIDVFVQHLGAVIRRSSAQLLYFNNRLTLVDAFAIPLLHVDPSSGNGRLTTQITSQLQPGSALNLDLAIQCMANHFGKNCDLQCGTLGQTNNNNNNQVICSSQIDGNIQSCQYNSARTQVLNCVDCLNNSYNATSGLCTNNNGTPVVSGLVSHAFRTWTIVLGVLLGLALLLILCLIIAYIILRNRENEDYDNAPAVYKPPSQPASQQYSNGSNARTADEWATPARRPLLQDPNDEPYRQTTTTVTTTQQRQEHAV
ncbi:unnamed protein product, partial [Mesorhabditis spiculigera]